jgi:glycosyltransferase involved in cell wall biosynthesis
MKIAQVAPLFESIPPKMYGGTERIVYWLTQELSARGHEVTLFGTGDSEVDAKLIPICPRGLRLEQAFGLDKLGFHILMFEQVLKHANEFDVVHFHSDYWHLPYLRSLGVPALTTTHSRLDYIPLESIYEANPGVAVNSISNAQRKPIPWLNWQANIYHGLPENQYHLGTGEGKYMLFLGRICPEKRPDRAIEIAKQAKIPLKIAAKVDPADTIYYAEEIKPLLENNEYVEYIGEINDIQKQEIIGNALALIHPVEFPEPFGIAMIEAMACGTPVVGFRTGSIPEVIDEGLTGYVVDNIPDAVKAIQKVGNLSRKQIREVFERRFTSSRMASDYLDVYQRLIDQKQSTKMVGIEHEPAFMSVPK